MARARNIKPAFFTDGELTERPPLARLLFAGLWCLADREGRLKDKPKDIKLQVLPADDCDVNALLEALSPHFILRYEVKGERYIQINSFGRHQNPHKNETASCLPSPFPCGSPQNASPRADVLIPDALIPDVPIPDTPTPRPDGEMPPGRDEPATTRNLFERFWRAYPKKRSKGEAEKVFLALRPTQELLEQMLQAVRVQQACPGWQREKGRYIPYPANWLRARGWEDEPATGSGPKRPDVLAAAAHYTPMAHRDK